MTKGIRGRASEVATGWSYSTVRRPARLGSYMYLPAPNMAGSTKGVLVKGGLPVTLEVIEGTLQEFMDAISSLETDISRRWPSPEAGFCVPTE